MRTIIYTDGRNFYALRQASRKILLLKPCAEEAGAETPGEGRAREAGTRTCHANKSKAGRNLEAEALGSEETKNMRTYETKAGAAAGGQGTDGLKIAYEDEFAKPLARLAEAGRLIAEAEKMLLSLV